MVEWSFLTNLAPGARVHLHDPGVRLRGLATALGTTERRACGRVSRTGRCGLRGKGEGWSSQPRHPDQTALPEAICRVRTIGDVLDRLVDACLFRGTGSGSAHEGRGNRLREVRAR